VRIALFAASFTPSLGGVERFVEVLADWLSGAGHEVKVLTPTIGGDDSRLAYEVVRRPSLSKMVAAVRWADVVHVKSLSTKAALAGLLGAKTAVVTHSQHQAICPTQAAWSESGPCSAGPAPGPCPVCPHRGVRARCHLWRQRSSALAAKKNVCISDYLLQRLGLPRSVVVFNPVEPRAFRTQSQPDAGTPTVAFAGRLSPTKGLDVLIEALARLDDVRLEVAGTGPDQLRCQQLASALGVADRVGFLGRASFDGVAELYGRANVVCVPSVWQEPFGYAAAEAMAMGCAVVGTPSGALPELLAKGRGFVSGSFSPVDLAETLRAALSDPAACRIAGSEARRFASEELSVDVVGERYVELYRG